MTYIDPNTDYIKGLRAISGTSFQKEMEGLLSSNFTFQVIPTKPTGDGGLDGLSHNQTRAYCCYGLELHTGKIEASNIIEKIKNKFGSDLRKLCELKQKKKGTPLEHSENESLSKIIGNGNKIKTINLLCNWFEDHSLIGHFNSLLKEYIKLSQCRFIDSNCEIILSGPVEICTAYTVRHEDILRVSNPTLAALLHELKSQNSTHGIVDEENELDSKFDHLKTTLGISKETVVEKTREEKRNDWLKGLKLMKDLEDNHPDLHRKVDEIRNRVGKEAEAEALGTLNNQPGDIINKYQQRLTDELSRHLIILGQSNIDQIADYSLAWLIGTCKVDWRP